MLAGGTRSELAPATRTEALERLRAFIPNAGRAYASTRNADYGRGDRSNVSTLSAWIRHRLLLEEETIRAVLEAHSFSAAEKFVQEVFWRSYFKGWLEHRPQVWARYRRDVSQLTGELQNDADLRARFETAVQGQTGIACFDSWAQELVETGYLHNHTRMWFASIWIFTLKLPWQLGADFFLRHLLDGDPASNTLGWRWVGGLHTKGKTYLARPSNIERFTQGRFNPSGQLSNDAPALLEADLEPPVPIARLPKPEIKAPFAVLITEEDCFPESLEISGEPSAVIGVNAPGIRSPLPSAQHVEKFAYSAVEDALQRYSSQFALTYDHHTTDDWPTTVAAWAHQAEVTSIVTSDAPIGPTAELLAQAEDALLTMGIELIRVRRAYDDAVWPHSSKGFFGLKKKIPVLIADLGL